MIGRYLDGGSLPDVMSQYPSLDPDSSGITPCLSATTTAATGDLAGSTRTKDGLLLAMLETPAKDDQLQTISWGSASVENSYDIVHTPSNRNETSSYPYPLIPNGTFLGHEGSGFAPYGEGEQSNTLKGEPKAERWPYRYHVPVGYSPACKSNRTHKRRRFTNGEKMIISYKRKVGVCRDCRHAKRKASLVMTSVFFC